MTYEEWLNKFNKVRGRASYNEYLKIRGQDLWAVGGAARKEFNRSAKKIKKRRKKAARARTKKKKEREKAKRNAYFEKHKKEIFSERAKKGWETRRKNEAKRKAASERAKKGWQTRRENWAGFTQLVGEIGKSLEAMNEYGGKQFAKEFSDTITELMRDGYRPAQIGAAYNKMVELGDEFKFEMTYYNRRSNATAAREWMGRLDEAVRQEKPAGSPSNIDWNIYEVLDEKTNSVISDFVATAKEVTEAETPEGGIAEMPPAPKQEPDPQEWLDLFN